MSIQINSFLDYFVHLWGYFLGVFYDLLKPSNTYHARRSSVSKLHAHWLGVVIEGFTIRNPISFEKYYPRKVKDATHAAVLCLNRGFELVILQICKHFFVKREINRLISNSGFAILKPNCIMVNGQPNI